MTTQALPPSIKLFDHEDAHSDLDYSYIDTVGAYVAERFAAGVTSEVAYQPGDWTFYGLVIAPLHALDSAPARKDDGETHAFRGAARRGPGGEWAYPDTWALVCWNENGSYTFDLEHQDGIEGYYVGDKLGAPPVSGVSIALLLRSIAWHLAPKLGHDFGSTPMGLAQVQARASDLVEITPEARAAVERLLNDGPPLMDTPNDENGDNARRALRALQVADEAMPMEVYVKHGRSWLLEVQDRLGRELGLTCTGEREHEQEGDVVAYDHNGDTCPIHEWLVTSDESGTGKRV